MLASIKVKEYMGRTRTTFTPDMDVLRAIHILIEQRISGAPVIDDHGNLIGFLSEKDCMKVALNAGYHGESGGRVSEFMANEIKTIDVETPIIELAEFFLKSPFRRYPVVEDNRLVGAISRRDVLMALEVMSAPEANKK
ncbi:MAG: CBS domain-containing protein [Gammaproteobacteria bacterium]